MKPASLTRAIETVGSVKALAALIGVTPQGISQWKRVPAHRAAQIERVTGIPRHELRPDLWDAPARTAAPAQVERVA